MNWLNWKKFPYWAKGGIIVVVVLFLLSFLGGGFMGLILLSPAGLTIVSVSPSTGRWLDNALPATITLSIIYYFLFGAFLGWLYGKKHSYCWIAVAIIVSFTVVIWMLLGM